MRNEVAEAMAELVRCLVDDCDAVNIQTLEAATVTVLEIEVAPPDFGEVLGRRGESANALRTLLIRISGAQQRQVTLSLVDPEAVGPVRFQGCKGPASSTPVRDPVERTRRMLEGLVRLLVDQPECASISATEGSELVVFEVQAARGDLKNLIGVAGARANALRLLAGKMGVVVGRGFMLQLVEPVEG